LNSLFDTNVLSEYKSRSADPGVLAWLAQADFQTVYVSVATLSEIRMGIDRLAAGRRRDELEHWLTAELPLEMGDHVLDITPPIADRCGAIRARAFQAGRPMAVIDAMLAATAEVEHLTVVTRNVRDFEVWGGPLFNPWTRT
jgi:predicted nucleic acid-binding protein